MTGDAIREVLLACLHQEPNRLDEAALYAIDDAGWDRVLALATAQRVRPLLHRRLAGRNLRALVPERVWQALRQASWQTATRTLRLQANMAALARALAADDIPVIVLKGAYLAHDIYGNAALREMNDLDILVRQEHLQLAVDVLVAHGYKPSRPFSVDLHTIVSHHVTRLMKPGTAGVEIHWNITTPNQIYSIDPADLWLRAVPVQIGGIAMFALSPEDLLLHLCLHTSYQHRFEFGLRPFCDIAATIRRFQSEISWHDVQRRSREWKWGRGVHLALYLANDLVGAAVPAEVLAVLTATDYDADMVETARAQVFAEKAELDGMGQEFARLREDGSLRARVCHLCRRIFVSRSNLGAIYAVDPHSSTIALFYAVRVRDLMRRYGGMAMRLLWKGEPELVSIAERKNRLRKWLIEP